MRKLWVSVSGGRTSAFMAIRLKQDYSDRFDMKFIYANTGQEDEQTLIFLDRLDREYSLDLTWLECVPHKDHGKSSTHRVVCFDTADRAGKVFEDMIKVYGIPNKAYPHCNRELKINPMKSYIRSIGWQNEPTAIGIRFDEMGRLPKDAGKERKVYPLVDWFPTEKADVLDFFQAHGFDLNLPEHRGNCVTCWKKSDKKILRLINEDPAAFDFFKRMEAENGLAGHNIDGSKRVFYINNRSTKDMFMLSHAMPELDFGNLDRCGEEECGMV